jgi:transposase-like protein
MRYAAGEKLEIIRLVEQSPLPVGHTLTKLGIPRATFYRWYDRHSRGGPEALNDRSPRPDRVWNRIPESSPLRHNDGGSSARQRLRLVSKPTSSPVSMSTVMIDSRISPRHCRLKQRWYPLAVGGAAVRCREVFGTPMALPPSRKRGQEDRLDQVNLTMRKGEIAGSQPQNSLLNNCTPKILASCKLPKPLMSAVRRYRSSCMVQLGRRTVLRPSH